MDAYDIQARHAPVVFTILPALLVAIALVPGLGQTKIAAGSIAFIILTALPFVAIRIADNGDATVSRHAPQSTNEKNLSGALGPPRNQLPASRRG